MQIKSYFALLFTFDLSHCYIFIRHTILISKIIVWLGIAYLSAEKSCRLESILFAKLE